MHVSRVIMDKILSVLEVVLAVFMIILVIVMTVRLFSDTFFSGNPIIGMSGEFIENVLNLAIGIEFAKMLYHHTPETIIEVLMFAISRHMIAQSPTPAETCLGVLSIAGLFAVKKFLFTDFKAHDYVICSGRTTIRGIKLRYGIGLPVDGSKRIGDYLRETLEQQNLPVEAGSRITIGEAAFLIDKMEEGNIKKVEIIYTKND